MPDMYIRELGTTLNIGGDSTQIEEDIKLLETNNAYSEEIWLKIGQSNSVGTDGNGPIDSILDVSNPRLYEFSRGVNKSTYQAMPAGSLMPYRVPAQDDSAGIGFGQQFGNRRLELNNSIQKLIIINRGVGGTGFAGNRWNPGDDLYTLAVSDLILALQNNPNAVFAGILWHQGESDAGQGQSFYENALSTMVRGIIDEAKQIAPNRVRPVFVLGTMVETWIQMNETDRRPIDDAHRNVSSYISNSSFSDFSDLTDLQDSIHFGTGSLREMGKRYAESAQIIKPVFENYHRLKVIDGQVVDLFNGGATLSTPTIVEDATRGEVIDTQNAGILTSIFINPSSYTKSCWVNVNAIPAAYGNLLSGTDTGDGVTNNHYWGWSGSGQNASPTTPTATGISTHAPVGVWTHVTLTSDGDQHILYVDGVQVGTHTANILTTGVQTYLGSIVDETSNTLDCLVDDIVILPFALDASGALSLYNTTL